MRSDVDLLRQFAETKDEQSFAVLVQRHIGFVHAVSMRRLRDPHAAQDATQAVFVALARKAASVARHPSVVGWLHRSATFESRNLMRSQSNRLARESEAQRLGTTFSELRRPDAEVEAVLDDALHDLPPNDREAIIARFFSEQSYGEIGRALRVTENAARMRVERALEKLRHSLAARGVTSTAAILVGTLPTYASTTVPPGLVAAVTKTAVLSAAGVSGTTAFMTFMSSAKLVTGTALIALSGGALYEYVRASDLEARLAQVTKEHETSRQQVAALQRDFAEFKRRPVPVERPASAPTPATVRTAESVPEPPSPGITPKAPAGWFKNGSANDLYEVGVDEKNAWGGMPSAYAKSTGTATGKFGGMMQSISADAFKNQRIRLNAWVKTEDAVEGGGHLWLRIDGKESNKTLGFDNMDGRAPKGTTDWQDYSIVLDVPPDALKVNYGFFVSGNGKMWVNGLTIVPVGTEVPTTNMLKPPSALPRTPVNLGFSPPQD